MRDIWAVPPGGPVRQPVKPPRSLPSIPIPKPILACLAVLIAAIVFFRLMPLGAPGAVVVLGIIVGCLNGLLAMGLVLIYKANRIINFAQGGLGAFGAVLAFELMSVMEWSYFVAVPLAIIAGTGMAALVEFVFMRRLFTLPRLIVTVATIGLAQIFAFFELAMPAIFEKYAPGGRGADAVGTIFPTPFGQKAFEIFPFIFRYDHIIVMVAVPVILIAFTIFFRRSWSGVAIRGAAENEERAALLGVPVRRLSTITWALAGALSAMAAILKAPVAGFATGTLAGPGLFLRALVPAVIGRMDSLAITFGASLVLGVLEQVIFYNFSQAAPIDGLLLALVIVALLARRSTLSGARAAWVEATSWSGVKPIRGIPKEMRALREVKIGRWVGGACLLAAALALPLVLGVRDTRLISVIWVYAMVAVSLVLLTGWAGQVSLGQWALVGVGAFTAAKLDTYQSHPSFLPALLICGLVGAFVAILIGLPALRIRGFFLGATTLAFAVAAGNWFFTFGQIQQTRRLPRPVLFGTPLDTEMHYYFVTLGFLILSIVVAFNLRRSRVGRLLIASRDNEQAARAFGVDVFKARLTAFAVSGFIAAMAGGVYAYLVQNFTSRDFSGELSLFVFAMAVIGGLGSIVGGVLGAAYVQGAQFFLPEWGGFLATGLGMLLLLMVLPGGLGQLVYTYRDRLLLRLARRKGMIVPSLLEGKAAETEPEPVPKPMAVAQEVAPVDEPPNHNSEPKPEPEPVGRPR